MLFIIVDSKIKETFNTTPLNNVNGSPYQNKNKQVKISEFVKTAKKLFGKPKTSPIFATSNKDAASPAGGTGRRVGLKHQYLRMCRFDSGAGYFKESELVTVRFLI